MQVFFSYNFSCLTDLLNSIHRPMCCRSRTSGLESLKVEHKITNATLSHSSREYAEGITFPESYVLEGIIPSEKEAQTMDTPV